MIGLGLRREMADWDLATLAADFFEVAPENWLRRDRTPLQQIVAAGRPVWLHGVSLNLGGHGALQPAFIQGLRELMAELSATGLPVHYSDHLAASGDAHQLYDLFPIACTEAEAQRVAGRIAAVQDALGQRMAVENTTWYANVGDLPEPDFIQRVLELADCDLLLDVNNAHVNFKNHGGLTAEAFVARIDASRVRYLHVAGHEFDARFGLYIDTHSARVEPATVALARQWQADHGHPILLEWDNDVPTPEVLNEELQCLRLHSSTT